MANALPLCINSFSSQYVVDKILKEQEGRQKRYTNTKEADGSPREIQVLPFTADGVTINANGSVGIDTDHESYTALWNKKVVDLTSQPKTQTVLGIILIAGNLFSIATVHKGEEPPHSMLSEIPIEYLLFQHLLECGQMVDCFHCTLLQEERFSPLQEMMFRLALSEDAEGALCLFSLPRNIQHILLQNKHFLTQPSNIIEPKSGDNLYKCYARGTYPFSGLSHPVLLTLIQRFPEDFLTQCEPILLACLTNEYVHPYWDRFQESEFFHILEEYKPHLSPFCQLLADVAQRRAPSLQDNQFIDTLSLKEKKLLYQVAHKFRNPFYHEPAEEEIPAADDYTINLLWINRAPVRSDAQLFLIKDLETNTTLINTASEWSEGHPDTPVQIWFDGQLVPADCIERTKQLVPQHLQGVIVFRDIRDLADVKEHPEAFSHDIAYTCAVSEKPERNPHVLWISNGDYVSASLTPFARANLGRQIIVDEMLKHTKYCIYTDIDVKALPKEKLWGPRVLSDLQAIGCVFSGLTRTRLGIENSFQIWSNQNPTMLELHSEYVINRTFQVIKNNPRELMEDPNFGFFRCEQMWREFSKKTGKIMVAPSTITVNHPPSQLGAGLPLPGIHTIPEK